MSTRKFETNMTGPELGQMLRRWRDLRGKSQIELSLDTGVSQRHLSFIESGRSIPGRQTLMHIAQALGMPFRERNALLLAAGYAPIYSEDAWNAREMQSITKALERILRNHEPFPAVVMDRYWNVLLANESTLRFFNSFIDMATRAKPRNLLHLMFDPAGMRPFIANWESAAAGLIQRIHRESVGNVIDPKTRDLLNTLRAYTTDLDEPMATGSTGNNEALLPVIPLSFLKDGQLLNYFSMITTVGTPQTITAQEMRIECMFPADEQTERLHMELMSIAGRQQPD